MRSKSRNHVASVKIMVIKRIGKKVLQALLTADSMISEKGPHPIWF
jgi:hypothetical protein